MDTSRFAHKIAKFCIPNWCKTFFLESEIMTQDMTCPIFLNLLPTTLYFEYFDHLWCRSKINVLMKNWSSGTSKRWLPRKKKENKTGVINDPFGQTHSHISSDHYSRSTFVLFCEILKSGDERTDGQTCGKIVTVGVWVGLVDQKSLWKVAGWLERRRKSFSGLFVINYVPQWKQQPPSPTFPSRKSKIKV